MLDTNYRVNNPDLKKKLGLIIVFFTITPIVIATSLFSIFSIKKPVGEVLAQGTTNEEVDVLGLQVFAALPGENTLISSEIGVEDARGVLLENYLASHYSPLEPYANYIVEVSDQYDLDYRLLIAIAQKESNLCKIIPEDTYNCWGWGIHSQGTLGFNSYSEGIRTVAQGIKENYVDKGYDTVEKIMSKYTPLSKGTWAEGVLKFMNDIESLDY